MKAVDEKAIKIEKSALLPMWEYIEKQLNGCRH